MSGRNRGFAFVHFDAADQAESAMTTLQGLEIDGRRLKIDLAGNKPTRSQSLGSVQPDRTNSENSLYIGNLPFEASNRDVQQLCNDILGEGRITRVRIATDRASGKF
jgi:RNA recognition motif-containing protein